MCCIKEKVYTTYTYIKTNRGDNTTAPYKEPNQSTNSIKEVMLSPMYTLTQSQNRYKKKNFKKIDLSIPCPQKLSYYIPSKWTKKKQRRATFQAFFLFLPTRTPFQLKTPPPPPPPPTEECITHCMWKRAQTSWHIVLAFGQCKSKWSPISSSALHM